MKITTIEQLREHLEAAVQLELAVIPPYMCALYTIKPNTNEGSVQIIRSVLAEEMLHLINSANVLNAVGGTPSVASPDVVPRYPTYLPDGEKAFLIHLLPFSQAAIDQSLKVELPSRPHEAPAILSTRQPMRLKIAELAYPTVGEFYQAIIDGLRDLVEQHGEPAIFTGDPARQVTPEYYYAGGGRPTVVHDLDSGVRALEEVSDQGEGISPSMYDGDGDLAHFFRLYQIHCDRYYVRSRGDALTAEARIQIAGPYPEPTGAPVGVSFADAIPMHPDPVIDDYPPGELRDVAIAFSRSYTQLLQTIERALTGEPQALLIAVPMMFDIKWQAFAILNNPWPGSAAMYAGPTFELVV